MWENGKSQLRGEAGRLVGQPWRKEGWGQGVKRAAKAPALCELSAVPEQCEKSAGIIRFPFCLHI